MSWPGKYMFASALLASMITSAQAAQEPTAKDTSESFQVKFSNGYLSVNAREAPLVKIFDEIRKQAKIAVDGSIGPEEKITIQFERVAWRSDWLGRAGIISLMMPYSSALERKQSKLWRCANTSTSTPMHQYPQAKSRWERKRRITRGGHGEESASKKSILRNTWQDVSRRFCFFPVLSPMRKALCFT